MKTILIDPHALTISVLDLKADADDRTLPEIYRILDCTTVEVPINYPNRDGLYCDEEAWMNVGYDEKLAGFMFPGWSYPILGKALIVGTDLEGGDVDCLTDVATLFTIKWVDDTQMRAWGRHVGVI
ncbi:MAG TPA: hypothetical protein DCL77_01730 [Prolixibacteraceae bacterium]|jgi:hypothetical protein|nr:hypothetical protein [Prolixibacteraceae bacterium]